MPIAGKKTFPALPRDASYPVYLSCFPCDIKNGV